MSNQWNSHESRIRALEKWVQSFEREPVLTPLEDPMPQGEWVSAKDIVVHPAPVPVLDDFKVREYLVKWMERNGVGRIVAPLTLWMELGKELGIATEPRLLIRSPADADA